MIIAATAKSVLVPVSVPALHLTLVVEQPREDRLFSGWTVRSLATLLLVADQLLDLFRLSDIDGQLSSLVPCVQLGAVAEQIRDDAGMSLTRGNMQRSPALVIKLLLVSPSICQPLHH